MSRRWVPSSLRFMRWLMSVVGSLRAPLGCVAWQSEVENKQLRKALAQKNALTPYYSTVSTIMSHATYAQCEENSDPGYGADGNGAVRPEGGQGSYPFERVPSGRLSRLGSTAIISGSSIFEDA